MNGTTQRAIRIECVGNECGYSQCAICDRWEEDCQVRVLCLRKPEYVKCVTVCSSECEKKAREEEAA